MQELFNNIGQVAVIAALIALIGVVLKALVDWLTTSRSKYVDVIAAERIKWVRELRVDLSGFLTDLDEVGFQCRQKTLNKDAANKSLDEVNKHLSMIQLKLNYGDELDRNLLYTLTRTAYVARTGTLEEYSEHKSTLVRFCSLLLKEEWEKAKRESSGPLRWTWLYFKRRKRIVERELFVGSAPVRAILEAASKPLSELEKERLNLQGAILPGEKAVNTAEAASDELP
jgi:hypothetical protein